MKPIIDRARYFSTWGPRVANLQCQDEFFGRVNGRFAVGPALTNWSQEWRTCQPHRLLIEYASQVRYPVDRETAGMLVALRKHEIVPWWQFEAQYVSQWASEWISEGRDSGLADDKELLQACQRVWSRLDSIVQTQRIPSGAHALMVGFPWGPDRITSTPLVQQRWLDWTVIVLVESTARLANQGFWFLPSIDRHPLAWKRFYPPDTNWEDPHPLALEAVEEFRRETVDHLHELEVWCKEVGRRKCIQFDKYVDWQGRKAPRPALQIGPLIDPWNKQIANELGSVKTDGPLPGQLQHSGTYPTNLDYDILSPEEVRAGVRHRGQVFDRIRTIAKSLRPPSPDLFAVFGICEPTERQIRIVDILLRMPCTKEKLAERLGCDDRTLYKRGGLNELMIAGMVDNDRARGGYCLAGRAWRALCDIPDLPDPSDGSPSDIE